RQALLADKLPVSDENGVVLGTATVKPSGKWSLRINGLTTDTAPCMVQAVFAGQKGSRDVRKAPARCGG
ncbi:MAG: hypothetical protein H6R26_2934, partial [Proteobacteria bacterium]|nr:hypothetical protein [Pseudomonadota bacterium]